MRHQNKWRLQTFLQLNGARLSRDLAIASDVQFQSLPCRVSNMSAHALPPSIVPEAPVETVYLVLDDFGRLGRAYVETDEKKADLETVVHALMTGQYSGPVRVVAFNLIEGWANDVSKDVAREVLERTRLEQRDLANLTSFVELHTGEDVTAFLQSEVTARLPQGTTPFR